MLFYQSIQQIYHEQYKSTKMNLSSQTLLAFFIQQVSLHSVYAETLADYPTVVQNEFFSKNKIAENVQPEDILTQRVGPGRALSNKCAGSVSVDDLELNTSLFEGMTCKRNGNDTTCPNFGVYRKVSKINGKRVTVTATKFDNGNIEKLQVASSNCVQYFDGVSDTSRSSSGESILAAVSPLSFAAASSEQVNDTIEEDNNRRLLRSIETSSIGHRELAACTDGPNKVVEVALAIDSSFCQRNGNNIKSAMKSVAATFAFTVGLHETNSCMTLHLNFMEAYCNGGGIYRALTDNNSGVVCGVANGLVDRFKSIWKANRSDVVTQIAHLILDDGSNDGSCAIITQGQFCSNSDFTPNSGFGYDNLFYENIGQRATILAHEIVSSLRIFFIEYTSLYLRTFS